MCVEHNRQSITLMKSLTADTVTRAAGPTPGVGGQESAALGPASPSPDFDPEPFRIVRGKQGHPPKGQGQCAGLMKNGKPCGMRATLLCTDGRRYCRRHRGDHLPMKHTPAAGPLGPPPSKLNTKADVDKAYRW